MLEEKCLRFQYNSTEGYLKNKFYYFTLFKYSIAEKGKRTFW